MTTRHKHADVIIAWANGAEIEYRVHRAGVWVPSDNPGWNEEYEYRVKPPTRKYRVALFVGVFKETHTAESPDEADSYETRNGFVRWLTDWIEYEE